MVKTIYVSIKGNDNNIGTYDYPLRTIQKAVNSASSGTSVRILPGAYRESVVFSRSGSYLFPIKVVVDPRDRGKVTVVGSESSVSLEWKRCTSQSCSDIPLSARSYVYYSDTQFTSVPNLVYEETQDGIIHPLRIARTPNFMVTTDWKYHEHWWSASESSDSGNILKDSKLKKLKDLIGARIYLIDGGSRCGQFVYPITISNYNRTKAEIKFDNPVGFSIFGSQEQGISKYSKYYVEGKTELLDEKGEWYYDQIRKKLYIWPIEEKDPHDLQIEISTRSFGFDLSKTSFVEIDGVTFRYINEDRERAFEQTGAIIINPDKNISVQNISLKNTDIQYSGNGIALYAPDSTSGIQDILITNSNIGYILRSEFLAVSSTHSPSNISDIVISNSKFYKSSFLYNDIALYFERVSDVKLINNQVTSHANYGILFKSYEKDKGVSQNILIKDNIVDNNCLNLSSCSGIKMYGGNYKNTVLKNNVIINNKGWSYCQDATRESFAHGLFISNANGIQVIGNKSFNNTGDAFVVYPRQLVANNNTFLDNFAGTSYRGINLSHPDGVFDYDETAYNNRHDNTVIKNNTFKENRIGIELDPANSEKVQIDNNNYIGNSIDMLYKSISLPKVKDIRKTVPNWDLRSIDD